VNFFSSKNIKFTAGCPSLPSQMKTVVCAMEDLQCNTDGPSSEEDNLSQEPHDRQEEDGFSPEPQERRRTASSIRLKTGKNCLIRLKTGKNCLIRLKTGKNCLIRLSKTNALNIIGSK